MPRTYARRCLQVGVTALGAVALVAGTAPGAVAADSVRKPAVSGLANPGVVQDVEAGRWVIHGTGSWDSHSVSVSSTASASSSYGKVAKRRLLKKGTAPSWMGSISSEGKEDHSIWAPSVTRSASGTYVAYFAVTVKKAGSARCIGTGTGPSAQGPFTASPRALACWKGSGASPVDQIRSEGTRFSLIDPTPVRLSSNELVLTYKTQIRKSGKWHTTTRLVRLDPNDPTRTAPNPAHADGGSIRISDKTHQYIEENPVLAKRGGTYTLFTSFGWYGTCNYITRYHQTKSLWSSKAWLKARSTDLPFFKGLNTCGRGNAQVVGTGGDKWLIYFNGHASRTSTPGGPKNLYVKALRWKSGKPYVANARS